MAKILWASPFFLHPTEKGAQIRTLGILRELHRRHEVHFVALQLPGQDEGPRHAGEYSTRSYAVPHHPPARASLAFLPQLAASLLSPLPLAVSRYVSAPMRDLVARLAASERFDGVVCDFLHVAPNVPDLRQSVLFQHNVETTIWERHREHAPTPFHRAYFGLQAGRMRAYEGEVCRTCRHVVAVSDTDARRMRDLFGVDHVTAMSTGVDIDYYAPPAAPPAPKADFVFTGSMDWLPNVDGTGYFVREILPLIRRRRPNCTVAIVGRNPDKAVLALAESDPGVLVTGTVPDVRPYLWGSRVAIVPLRIGGGTRLKIYEAMAAGAPLVSTTVGAEGLTYTHGDDILIGDDPPSFADHCLSLLESPERARRQSEAGLQLVRSRFSWETVAREFEQALLVGAAPHAA